MGDVNKVLSLKSIALRVSYEKHCESLQGTFILQ